MNDGSNDETVIATRVAEANKIVSHRFNRGLGMAFRTDMKLLWKIGVDIIVNIDADVQFNPDDIPRIIKPIQEIGQI